MGSSFSLVFYFPAPVEIRRLAHARSPAMDMNQGKLQSGLAQSALERDAKHAARKQWGENPCGAHVAGGLEFGTLEFFEAIERYRYQVYAPWMKEVIGFDRYRGK